ncbi:sigma-70 family RNA polymerase sigma factor [Pedobacter nototheniae]|uniref:RNA polymerase sigma factor n=1 Tax=Pedobacter nototheniae TaxID=2488994 RepID=UPI00292F497C|nr:sigma-70 family RNA polymerase sigma factor [Pedobacter nototheniae]
MKKTILEIEFEANVKAYKLLIYKICRMYVNSHDDIQDLYQDIIIQLWRSYPKFRGDSKFSTWLYRIAINTALTNFRKQKRSVQTTDVEIQNIEIPDYDHDGQKEDQHQQLYTAIQALNDVEKSIVMLYLEDKSYDEMEEVLGISNATLRVKMNRIKDKLRTLTNNK